MLYQITLEDIPEKYMGWIHEVSNEFSDCFMVSTELMPSYSLDTNYALTFTSIDINNANTAKHVMCYISDKIMKATILEESINIDEKKNLKYIYELFIRSFRTWIYDLKTKFKRKYKQNLRKLYRKKCKFYHLLHI